MIFFKNILDFKFISFIESEILNQIQSIFSGNEKINDTCERNQDGKKIRGKDFIKRNVNINFVHLNVFHMHEIGKRDLLNPFRFQKGKI